MTDLSKTFGQLKTLFADNVLGNISAQDLRDYVESVFQYGSIDMHVSDTPTGGQTIGTAYEKLTQFTSREHVSSADVTTSIVNSNITISRAGVYAILCNISFGGSINVTWKGSLFIGGVDQDHIGFVRKVSTGGDVGSTSAFGVHTINAGDVLDYRVKADGSSKTIIMQSGSLFIFRIG